MNVKNATAIITGASRGLGASVSTALVREQCMVYGIARSADSLNRNAAENWRTIHPCGAGYHIEFSYHRLGK